MMNWTGGQLQRHHTRSGLLTKAQKQNFARLRLQKGTVISPPSPFRNFPDIEPSKGSSTGNRSVETEIKRNQVTEKPRFSLTGDQSSHETKELGDVKRQLLSQPDWAAVSATRPLEIAFTPVEEIERFGKRRKLNDNDRRRLTANPYGASNFFGPPESHRRKRNPSSVIDSIENIHIEIDGQRVAQSKDSSEVVMTMSSQSMLLDDQDSPLVEQDMEKENLTAAWITSLFPR